MSEPLFSGPTILWSLAQGVVSLGVVAAVYLAAPLSGLDAAQTRATTFAALVLAIVALILVNRVRTASVLVALSRRNRALGGIVLAVAAVLALVLLLPQARALFGFALPPTEWLAAPAAAGVAVLVLLEILKPGWFWLAGVRPARD